MSGAWNFHMGYQEDDFNTELIIHNFHPALTKQGLKSQFIKFGHVESANVMTNRHGNPVGFVRMKTVGECNRAIAVLNGRAPLHWSVQMAAPQAEVQRRRRNREEARRFDEEMRPIHAARLRAMQEHEQRMLDMTREFCNVLEAEESCAADEAEESNPSSPTDRSGDDDWPVAEGLRPCTVCAAPTPGYCQVCGAPYCSAQCQHADWERHKHDCRRAPAPLVVSVGQAADSPDAVRSVRLGDGETPAPLRRPDTGPRQQAGPAPARLGPVRLLPGHSYQVLVCYAADPSAVYLRLGDQYALVAEMEAALQRQVPPPAAGDGGTHAFQKGQLCAGRFEDSWYRAEVLAVGASHCQVHFLDWGNTAALAPRDLAPLPAALQAVPPQAVRAVLPWRPAGGGGGAWSRRQRDGLAALDGQRLTASVVATEPHVSVALFNDDGKNVLTMIGDSVEPVVERSPLPPLAQLEPDRKHVVVATSMADPQRVTAQLRDAALHRPYLAMTAALQTAARTEAALTVLPAVGSPVSVLCSPAGGGQAWHRAVVRRRLEDRAEVRLLDWGITEEAELSQLRPLPQAFSQVTAIGVQFGLHGIEATACSGEELAFYRSKLVGKEFLLEEVETAAGCAQVRLHLLSDTNSYCFNDKMLSRMAAVRAAAPAAVSPPPTDSPRKRSRQTSDRAPPRPLMLSDLADPALQTGDCHPFLVGQVLSAGCFYGSPLTEESAAALDRLETALAAVMERRPPPACAEPPRCGQLVVVLGADGADGWSRGAVVDTRGPGVQVRLLDLGQLEQVPLDRLCLMPPELERLPPASLCLAVRGCERWTEEQRRLAEKVLAGDGEETVLDLTVASVGRDGGATSVTCRQLDGLLGSPP